MMDWNVVCWFCIAWVLESERERETDTHTHTHTHTEKDRVCRCVCLWMQTHICVIVCDRGAPPSHELAASACACVCARAKALCVCERLHILLEAEQGRKWMSQAQFCIYSLNIKKPLWFIEDWNDAFCIKESTYERCFIVMYMTFNIAAPPKKNPTTSYVNIFEQLVLHALITHCGTALRFEFIL